MDQNIADRLIEQITIKKSPIVVGLDPVLNKIPKVYKDNKNSDYDSSARAILEFNIDIIDTIRDFVPAVKPQIAFYEMFGHSGIYAFEKTVEYAKQSGLIVIEDGKRNDIGNTAAAYADGHLGYVETIGSKLSSCYDVDFMTVSPFLGPESLQPFIKVAQENNKGLFILVKTSNFGSGMIQDTKTPDGKTISEALASLVNDYASNYKGKSGYSPIGAVVGATYPNEAKTLRQIMPSSILLVPGYGAQGGNAEDIVPCFNRDGLGAIVNASRSIIFAHYEVIGNNCNRDQYKDHVKEAVKKMRQDIYKTLKVSCSEMYY